MEFLASINKKPRYIDIIGLLLFVVLASFPPYLFHHEIINLDQGLYLPGIDAIFDGKIPQKDFIFYRGNFEIYAPALLMKVFGNNMIWLPVFFYIGTMINIIFAILIAGELYRTRFILYLMVPVFLARTFPRVSFYYWGGMRYALAMAGVYFVIKFLKTKQTPWILAAGVTTAMGFFTTIESGVSAACAILAGLGAAWLSRSINGPLFSRALKWFGVGVALVSIPFLAYLLVNNALGAYLYTTIIFPAKMSSTFLDIGTNIPASFGNFLISLLPNGTYFKVLTPVYFFLFLLGYLYVRSRKKDFNAEFAAIVSIGTYALILYIASFRAIWGHHFEMALQPEKVLYFFFIEDAYLLLMSKTEHWSKVLSGFKRKIMFILTAFIILGLAASCFLYAFARFDKRFPACAILYDRLRGKHPKDHSLLWNVPHKPLTIERARGMVVPAWQADDIEETVKFIKNHTSPGEPVLTYPELGVYNYFFDRPFVGKFPVPTLSWASEDWHREYFDDIKKANTRYALMTNLGDRTFASELYFRFPGNIVKFKAITSYILTHYHVVERLNSVSIYERNERVNIL